MVLTNDGKNHIISLLLGNSTEVLVNGGFGVDDETSVSDGFLQSQVLVVDSCDSTTDWSYGGDATAPTVDDVNFMEGSGSLNCGTTYSSGDAYYEKTITSIDLSGVNDKFYFFVYINDVNDLDDVDDAVYLLLGTGGFTDANKYAFARSTLSNGWNALIATVNEPNSTLGSGATTSSIDSVRVGFTSSNSITSGDLKIDYLRAVVDGGFGISDSKGAFVSTIGDRSMTLTYKALASQSNGYDISSAGVSTNSLLFSKNSFSVINKDDDTEIQIDEYFTVV